MFRRGFLERMKISLVAGGLEPIIELCLLLDLRISYFQGQCVQSAQALLHADRYFESHAQGHVMIEADTCSHVTPLPAPESPAVSEVGHRRSDRENSSAPLPGVRH